MDTLDTLIPIALDLTAALNTKDRYQRLLATLAKAIPYDAAALLRLDAGVLVPVAARGLSPDALGRRYPLRDHPRLDIICKADAPVRFPADNALPDPFEGMLAADADFLQHIHACLGCPLHADGRLIGALTADAIDPNAFDHLEQRFLTAVGALAGAQLQTAGLIDALEHRAERQGQIASDLMDDIFTHRGTQLLGNSPAMVHLRREIDLVARSDFTVLVLGETGVGKELVVRAIHKASDRSTGPMLYLNCAALPETLAESELFGHTRGAFTGAGRDRSGKFELADGGTLFLDEIGELAGSVQAKLLRAIQEGEIQRVGSEAMMQVDVRLLVATNRELEKEVEKGLFRADLFHRLNVYPITVPPLRDRREDIPLLTGHFCDCAQRRLGLGAVRIDSDVYDLLGGYAWPGNVRELENVISRAVLKASDGQSRGSSVIVRPIHVGSDLSPARWPSREPVAASGPALPDVASLREETKRFQRQMIDRALGASDGNWAAAARQLGMHRSNLHHLAVSLGIKKTK